MRKLIIILIIIFFTIISIKMYSQNNNDVSFFNRLIITTTISDYIPSEKFNAANINLGGEITFKNKKSLWLNIGMIKAYKSRPIWGYGFNYLPNLNLIGFKGQAEFRYYLNKHKIFEPATLLFWLHIFQFDSQELENTGYYVAIHSYFETIAFYSYYYGWNESQRNRRNVALQDINFGYQCIKKRGLTIDLSIGMGGRFIFSTFNDKYTSPPDFWSMIFYPKNGFSPNVIYQFRLGWKL